MEPKLKSSTNFTSRRSATAWRHIQCKRVAESTDICTTCHTWSESIEFSRITQHVSGLPLSLFFFIFLQLFP